MHEIILRRITNPAERSSPSPVYLVALDPEGAIRCAHWSTVVGRDERHKKQL